jgi:hypothetical protein
LINGAESPDAIELVKPFSIIEPSIYHIEGAQSKPFSGP